MNKMNGETSIFLCVATVCIALAFTFRGCQQEEVTLNYIKGGYEQTQTPSGQIIWVQTKMTYNGNMQIERMVTR